MIIVIIAIIIIAIIIIVIVIIVIIILVVKSGFLAHLCLTQHRWSSRRRHSLLPSSREIKPSQWTLFNIISLLLSLFLSSRWSKMNLWVYGGDKYQSVKYQFAYQGGNSIFTKMGEASRLVSDVIPNWQLSLY